MYTNLIKLVNNINASIAKIETIDGTNYAIVEKEDDTPIILTYNQLKETWE